MWPFTEQALIAAAAEVAARADASAATAATAVSVGVAADSVTYMVGNWTVTVGKTTKMLRAFDKFVRAIILLVALIWAFLARNWEFFAKLATLLFRFFFVPRPSPLASQDAAIRATGAEADRDGARRRYAQEIRRLPARDPQQLRQQIHR